MSQPNRDSITAVDLEKNEVALIIGDEDGAISVRVVAAADAAESAGELSAAPEIALALAMRLLKDPDFHDDVLDWYYEHQDDPDADEEEK